MDDATREVMKSGGTATISVSYRNIDGYHVFTSEDVFGLYVASQDAQQAFESLAPAVELLVSKNEGITCKVEPAMSFREFVDAQRAEAREVAIPHPAILQDKQFLLHRVG